MMEINWSKHHMPVRQTFVMWDFDDPVWRVNPGRQPTETESEDCPGQFTCYNCAEPHPKSELGRRYHDQWFCRECIPYIDDWTAGSIVWFDIHKVKHPNKTPKRKPRPMTDEERMGEVVAWAKANGKPIL